MLKFAGAIKTSNHFSGDPVEVQKTMRIPWALQRILTPAIRL